MRTIFWFKVYGLRLDTGVWEYVGNVTAHNREEALSQFNDLRNIYSQFYTEMEKLD